MKKVMTRMPPYGVLARVGVSAKRFANLQFTQKLLVDTKVVLNE
jgi:hypothetical protein